MRVNGDFLSPSTAAWLSAQGVFLERSRWYTPAVAEQVAMLSDMSAAEVEELIIKAMESEWPR